MPMSQEIEDAEPEKRTPQLVKLAQKAVGELVWLVTRCRPDLMLATSKLAAAITKNPEAVVQASEQVWAYLAGTPLEGLHFPLDPEDQILKVYADAAFGTTCHGCTLIMWGQSPILWKSSRHSTFSNSTAEAELMELVDAASAGDAIRVVIEELVDGKIISVAFTDSSSALAIATGETGAWRTRHLRRRALNLRWRVSRGDWAVRHLAGSEMPADLGTKILGAERFLKLREMLGMKDQGEKGGTQEKRKEEKKKAQTEAPSKEGVKKALQLLIVAATISTANSHSMVHYHSSKEIQEWRERTWYWLPLIFYTLFVILVTLLLPCLWRRFAPQPQPLQAGKGQGGESSDQARRRNQVKGKGKNEERQEAEVPFPTPLSMPMSSSQSSSSKGKGREERYIAIQERATHLFLTGTGGKYHVDRNCHGLRKAVHITESEWCRQCLHVGQRVQKLFSKGIGHKLHGSITEECTALESVDSFREYYPCHICVPLPAEPFIKGRSKDLSQT